MPYTALGTALELFPGVRFTNSAWRPDQVTGPLPPRALSATPAYDAAAISRDGHHWRSAQPPQSGLRAWQTRPPWMIRRWEKPGHSLGGSRHPRSLSILVGSCSRVNPRRLDNRLQCVSTATPGVAKAWPRITLAVFRPTPASFVSSAIVAGTLPPNSSTNCRAHRCRDFALARNKPSVRISASMSREEARGS